MGLYEEDEEEPTPEAAYAPGESHSLPPSTGNKQDILKAYLAQKYAAAADDTAVKEARDRANTQDMISIVGRGMEGLARSRSMANGGAGVNEAVWQGVRDHGQRGVENAESDRQAKIKKFVTEQQIGRDTLADSRATEADDRAKAEFGQKQTQWNAENAEHDPTSSTSTAVRTAYAKMFPDAVKGFGEDFNNLSAADIKTHLTNPLELKDKMKTNAAIVAAKQGERADAAADRKKSKDDQNDEKALKSMGDDLDPSKGRNGALGVATQKVANAQALQAMVHGQGDDLDPRQVHELAIGLNKLLSGSSAPAQSSVEALVPETARGDAAKLAEWLYNEPNGTGQQAFVKRMMETVDRESTMAKKQIETYQRGKLGKYEGLRKRRPDEFDAVLKPFEENYGVNLRQKEAAKPAEGAPPKAGAAPVAGGNAPTPAPPLVTAPDENTRVKNGVTYTRVDGGWKKVKTNNMVVEK